MAFETGLEGKPWYVAATAGLVITILVATATWFTVVDGKKKEIRKQERQQTKLQRRIDEARAAKKSLPQFREEVGRLELELDKLLKVLPARRNTEDLLRRLRTLTEQGDFKLLSFTPRRRSERQFYFAWPIQIRLEGSYHNLALFFDRISRFSRIINIENIDIKARGGGGGRRTISATFTMKTFLYIDRDKDDDSGGQA